MKRLFFIGIQRLFTIFKNLKSSDEVVLMFHKIGNENDKYTIEYKKFIQLLDFLSKNYMFSTIDEFSKKDGRKKIVLTFDDVDRSIYSYAFPILAKLNIPYYIFVNVEFIDKKGYLGKNEIKEMISNSRCIVGSHSMNHVMMRELSDEKCENQILESKKILEIDFGIDCQEFAFPFGSLYACSSKNYKIASKYYNYIFSTIDIPFNGDFKRIPRKNIYNDCKFVRRVVK